LLSTFVVMNSIITDFQLQKLGHTLVFLAKNVGLLNKTKLLKLLFLLEESSVRKYGRPMLGVPFHVWRLGPVFADIYVNLGEDESPILDEFIKKNQYDPSTYDPNIDFNDDYFSDDEIMLLEDISRFAKNKTASDLIEVTHKKGGLWFNAAQKNGLLEDFKSKKVTTTDFIIDFSLLFDGDIEKKEYYLESLETYELIQQLKG